MTMEYDPILYDSDNRDFLKEEIKFYESIVKKYSFQSILELGVGTGRIFCALLPLVKSGFGLDISKDMTSACKTRCAAFTNFTLVEESFIGFNLGRTFDLIYIPFNTFQHILKDDEQMSCLKSVTRHMHEGSRFVLDVMNRENIQVGISDWKEDYSVVLPKGSKLRRLQKTVTVNNDIVEKVFRYEQDGKLSSVRDFPALMRINPKSRIEKLISNAGLEVDQLWSDYHFGHDGGSKKFIYFLKKHAS